MAKKIDLALLNKGKAKKGAKKPKVDEKVLLRQEINDLKLDLNLHRIIIEKDSDPGLVPRN